MSQSRCKWVPKELYTNNHTLETRFRFMNINNSYHGPVEAAQYCLLHMYRQGRKRQIVLEGHCCKGIRGRHIIYGTLQCHPAKITSGKQLSSIPWNSIIVYTSQVRVVKLDTQSPVGHHNLNNSECTKSKYTLGHLSEKIQFMPFN